MVGVPGKSKGCTTCRKRKKKCDLQKPCCNRCLDSGNICEGYARYPVFIVRTNEGFVKRGRFEEAKNLREEESRRQPTVSSKNSRKTELVRGRNVTWNNMPPLSNNAKVSEVQLISTFWECYVPSSSCAQAGSPCPWLQKSIALTNPLPALRSSLKALAMTRLGWLHKDTTLVRGGIVMYGHALKEFRSALCFPKALCDQHSTMQDEAIATCNVLALYELHNTSPASTVGHHSHFEGWIRLITMRGSDRYKCASPLARDILHETLFKTMLLSIHSRKASPLGSYEWCTRSWSRKGQDHYSKDASQMLRDHGFALAALLEEVDNAVLTQEGPDAEIMQKYLRCCSAMDARLNLWYQDFTGRSDDPAYWLTPRDDSIELGSVNDPWASICKNFQPFSFPNLETANITTLYWALKLLISSTIADICSIALSTLTSPIATPLQVMAQQMLVKHGEEGRFENATNIMRSMPYCLHDSTGFMGASTSPVTLRVASLSLGRSRKKELNLCRQLYRDLCEKKGLGLAKQVADTLPK